MKKAYIIPSINVVSVESVQMMATSSLSVYRQGTDAEVLTNHRGGWNSESWSSFEEN